ncbi:MAG: serine/threonine protein kinase, partial [Planctomycetes bacterium]|nr:serine/threonine protein kinase [Planctomycetota bacterium]
ARVARFSGIGNIAGAILRGGELRSMVSHNGIVGNQLRKAQEFSYPWAADALLVMHSDGLQTRWNLDGSPGLPSRHPSVIAAALHRDAARGRDDASVVVVKQEA